MAERVAGRRVGGIELRSGTGRPRGRLEVELARDQRQAVKPDPVAAVGLDSAFGIQAGRRGLEAGLEGRSGQRAERDTGLEGAAGEPRGDGEQREGLYGTNHRLDSVMAL
ncbi:hypothetical protein D3C72_1657390 [compost metagenome]